MKVFFFIALVMFLTLSSAAHATTATVTNVFSAGQKIVASQMNTNFNDLVGLLNGNLDSTNISVGGISSASIASNSINNRALTDGAVSNEKIREGTIAQSKLSFIPQLSVATGSIVAYGAATAPDGWLLCDGASVSRVTYSALFAVIGTNFGTGNGSTTFNVPDTRGLFLRGWDNAATRDNASANRQACLHSNNSASYGGNTGNNIGSCQSSDMRSHTHAVGTGITGAFALVTGANGDAVGAPAETTAVGGNLDTLYGSSSSANPGTEVRPRNIYVNYIIKY